MGNNGKASYTFISYAHKDSGQVLDIVKKMEEHGITIWYDDGIEPGSEWDENIATHIKNCKCFVAFISKNYLESDNCRDELNYARDLGKKQLMIYLEDVSLPDGMAMRMNRLQAVFLYRYKESDKTGLEKILDACKSENENISKPVSKTRKSRKTIVLRIILSAMAAVCILLAGIILSVKLTKKNKTGTDTETDADSLSGEDLLYGAEDEIQTNSLIDNGSSSDIKENIDTMDDEELWKAVKEYTQENDNWSEIVPYLEKLSETGDDDACAYFGSYYAEHGGDSMEKAVEWCGKGIDKYNSGYCAYLLAYYYFYGKGSFEKPDYVSCLCYVDMAIRLGETNAAYYGAEIYYDGYLGEKDYYKAEQYAAVGAEGTEEELAEKCREILSEVE